MHRGHRAASWPVIAIVAVTLIAWNGALNLVPYPQWSYVPANLALTGVVVLWARRAGATDLGLGRRRLGRGVAAGLAVAVIVAAGLMVATMIPAAAPLLADARAAELSGWGLVFAAAVRIPLGTALAEEVIFRGALTDVVARRTTTARAVVISSAVFGLWHIGPTLALLRINEVEAGVWGATAAIAGSVVATAVAGVGFWLLRRWTGSLWAPITAHAAINALSLLAAAWVQTR